MYKHRDITKTYILYFICLVCFVLVRILSSSLVIQVGTTATSIIFTCIIQIGVMLLLPFALYVVMFKSSPKQTLKRASFNKITWRVSLTSAAIGVICFFIVLIISTVFTGFIMLLGYSSPVSFEPPMGGKVIGFWGFVIDFILIAILPAFCEEFLHRGVVLNNLEGIGHKKAIMLSALFFGLMHLNIEQFFYAFGVGVIIAFVVVVAKSVWPAVIIHFINNAISTYLTHASENGWFGSGFYEGINNLLAKNFFLVFAGSFILLSGTIFAFYYLIIKLYKQTTVIKVQKAICDIYDKATPKDNQPIIVNEEQVIKEVIESTTTINLDYEKMKSPFEIVMPKQKDLIRSTFNAKIWLFAVLMLGGLVTIFTLIWGIV